MPTMVLKSADRVHGKPQPAGHVFDATDKEARLWGALGRASAATGERLMAQSNEPAKVGEIDTLRTEFKAKTGADADPSWSIGRLKNEFRKAAGSYNRRDMRAEG